MFLRYGVWQMQLFFNLGYLSPFYPPNSWKISKKWKKPRDILILCKWTKMMLIGYTGPEIWHMTHVIVTFQFGLYENFTKKMKIKNLPGDIIILQKWTKMMFIGYTGPKILYVTHVIVTFQFVLYENFTKNEK